MSDYLVSLLWWVEPNVYECDWIRTCLSNVQYKEFVDLECVQTSIQNCVIVANTLRSKVNAFNDLQHHGIRFSLIHISDEYLDDDYQVYSLPCCSRIFRNYYHPLLSHPKVTTFGIGYRNDFWKKRETIANQNRPYTWSFAGYLKKSDRMLICNLFNHIEPHFLHESTGFNSGIIDPITYRDVILRSKFVLCPVGNCSIDTFRLYEALEGGSIPVTLVTNVNQPYIRMIANYWQAIFGTANIPFIMSNTWEENVQKVIYLLKNENVYNDLKGHVASFWKQYKEQLRDKFAFKLTSTSIMNHTLSNLGDTPSSTQEIED